MNRMTGKFVATATHGEEVRAFVPEPLPPTPPLDLTLDDQALLGEANRSLGRLDGVTALLPDTSLFLYMYVRKEAVLSSQIEGTQSSLSDLLLFEADSAPNVPLDDVQEVSNYVAAMSHGLKRLREDEFPLSLRLLREIHEILLSKGRGSDKTPGEFRRSQNWIGGRRPGKALYVPPPPAELMNCMGALEKFLHDSEVNTPTLLKAALAHVQFETIHPFLDGNGRLGRLLITFLLCTEKVLQEPLLYLSLYFKQNRSHYYDLLQGVREDGNWEAWVRFFLRGIVETSSRAVETARDILGLFDRDRQRMAGWGSVSSALRVHDVMQQKPLLSITRAAEGAGLSGPTVAKVFSQMEEIDMVREVTGKQRNRVYIYRSYVQLLNEGVEPLSPG